MEFGYKQLLGETIGFQARDYAEKAVYMVRNFTAGKTPMTNAHMHIVAGYRGAIASIAPDRRRNFQKPRQERARIRYAGKRAFPIHQSAPGRIRVRFARLFPSTS